MNNVKTILVPIDFSGNTDKVLAAANGIAQKFGAKIYLLFVAESLGEYSTFPIPHISTDVLAEEMLQQAKMKMGNFVEHHKDQGFDCEGTVLQSDDAAQEIVKYAKENKMDMIVMGTHGYKGLEKTLMGSVAERVLRAASCPVTVIKPEK